METLSNLESFVRSAESASFSAAARRLALTPAAVSRNVAQLERNLGVRLFQRSTRGLTLTEAGERFLHSVGAGLDSIQGAIAEVTAKAGEPAGVLKLSVAPRFGREQVLPLMPAFLARYPGVTLDLSFDNRPVDLIAGGYDAAIGGGFELTPGVVARELVPAHMIMVAAPSYLKGRKRPATPADLAAFDAIAMRSPETGKVKVRKMRNRLGEEVAAQLRPRVFINDPDAICSAALQGMGVATLVVADVVEHLESGALKRLLPDWYEDAGPISLYFTSQKLMPAKTRAFVDFVTESFRQRGLAKRYSAL
ncbi:MULTISPECIES: LysR family transcriptional regulator [unclassified Duganella]|uniref:LysR family transcriptional regulator n=1 Tax=unclassified Duganella TaxID=2636909 RepID=UPI000E34A2A9|nr:MULTISPECIES: LysR family transcriptional regulator [unclassified Duganella]RFP08051.1 LysR family transcriptional regulator [Duganella sp. BJB475]RFP23856.1 LysR family transcriptional regulator [Duganella sp. BJB476]